MYKYKGKGRLRHFTALQRRVMKFLSPHCRYCQMIYGLFYAKSTHIYYYAGVRINKDGRDSEKEEVGEEELKIFTQGLMN